MNLRLTGLAGCLLLAACGGGGDSMRSTAPKAPEANTGAASRVFDMPYQVRELDNGLRVIVVRTDYPDIVTLQIPVQTGSRNEVEDGKSGFAHFFEHMMFRGTENYPSAAYSATLKKAGAKNNAYTTDDYTNFHTTFTRPDLEKMIEIEADRFRNLSYSEADFRTEALAVKGEYLKNVSDPVQMAYERARSLAFRVHPYGHTTMGFIRDIEAMPEQFEYSRTFFSRWYRPEYTSVIVVGDVDPEKTYALVDKYWGGWEHGSYIANIPKEPPPEGPLYDHIRWEGQTQPWLFIGFRSPAFEPGKEDYAAMAVLSSIYFSDSSDLYRKLVIEDQSVDRLLRDFPRNKDPNLDLVYLRLTNDSRAAEVDAAVLDTFARARTELIDPARLAQTKSRLRFAFTASLDNSESIGSMLARYVQFERSPETVNAYYASLDKLTVEDIRQVANRYFTDSSRLTVSLSTSAAMAGVEDTPSIEERVVARGLSDMAAAAPASQDDAAREEIFETGGEAIPVEIVARQSASAPLVDVSILVHAGAAMDPAGKKGLAALTAAMLTEGGSATWSIQEINNAMYPIDSDFRAQVGKEMTRLSGQVHRDNLGTWYRYVRSQLFNPGWRKPDFERLKMQLVNAVRTDLVGDNDEELGKEVLYSAIYGMKHPYGAPSQGLTSDIAKLTLDDVRGFYKAHYTIRNITVGVAGGYPEKFVARLGDDLQSLPAGRRSELSVPPAPVLDGNAVTIVEKETPAVAVSFGFPIDLQRGDPDWIALWLVRSWLGEHRSELSHLYQRIREERGMNYGDYAYIEYFPEGMFSMRPGTNLGRQQQIFQVWLRPLRTNNDAHFATRVAVNEIDKLIAAGMSEKDFETTRQYLSKSVSLLMDGQSRQLGYALDSRYYEIGDFAKYVRDGLADLTLAEVNRVIRENLRTKGMQYVFVTRDAEDLQSRLADNRPSPMTYESDKPVDLLEEDKVIATKDLDIDKGAIRVITAESVFN